MESTGASLCIANCQPSVTASSRSPGRPSLWSVNGCAFRLAGLRGAGRHLATARRRSDTSPIARYH
jgi:hypothetical protein